MRNWILKISNAAIQIIASWITTNYRIADKPAVVQWAEINLHSFVERQSLGASSA